MTKLIRVFATLTAFAISATVALAHDYKLGELEIGHPWAKATITGQPVAGGFMKIHNSGTEPDRLIKVTSEVSDAIQIHKMSVENGVMKMGEVPGGLEVAPGTITELKPGGLHVMFMGIRAPFKEGGSVKAVLTFEKAGNVEVEFKIEAATKNAPDHTQHQAQ
jgi:periplasmic copper chaperone A